MTAYYNENDPYAAQWLRNLIAENLIAPGVVDERSILDVKARELREFTQCHFFAGIGIWSEALRSIGWPDNEPIWTGSCPCQPFSNAGKQKGFEDERHLWPLWKELIAKCNPSRVVGEQVASKAGRIWLDTVSADLEALGFAFGASDLCAAGFGGAHLRQRLYFVGLGQSSIQPGEWRSRSLRGAQESSAGPRNTNGRHRNRYSDASKTSGLADNDDEGLEGWDGVSEGGNQCTVGQGSVVDGLADFASRNAYTEWQQPGGPYGQQPNDGCSSAGSILHSGQTRSLDDADWLLCRNPAGEPSWRPVEPGTFPLAHGVAGRMGKLRAYGNALDFETAANFCAAVAEIEGL